MFGFGKKKEEPAAPDPSTTFVNPARLASNRSAQNVLSPGAPLSGSAAAAAAAAGGRSSVVSRSSVIGSPMPPASPAAGGPATPLSTDTPLSPVSHSSVSFSSPRPPPTPPSGPPPAGADLDDTTDAPDADGESSAILSPTASMASPTVPRPSIASGSARGARRMSAMNAGTIEVLNPMQKASQGKAKRLSTLPDEDARERSPPPPSGATVAPALRSVPLAPTRAMDLCESTDLPTAAAAANFAIYRDTVPLGSRVEGYLHRLERFKGNWEWQRRWCVISGCFLALFVDETEKVVVDYIVLGDDAAGFRITTVINSMKLWKSLGRKYVFAVVSCPKDDFKTEPESLPEDHCVPSATHYIPGRRRYMYFQAADADDVDYWLRIIRAQARFCREAPITSIWGVDVALTDALTINGVKPLTPGQVTPVGIQPEPLREYDLSDKVLGEGSFGQVILAVHRATGLDVAIKALVKPQNDDIKLQKVLRGEVACMERLRLRGPHANVVGILEVLEDATRVYVVMELAPGVELLKHIQSLATPTKPAATPEGGDDSDEEGKAAAAAGSPPAPRRRRKKGELLKKAKETHSHGPVAVGLGEDLARRVVRDVTRGIVHLHQCGVVHRDLKPENVQMMPNGDSMVLDLGFGMLLPFSVQLPMFGTVPSGLDMDESKTEEDDIPRPPPVEKRSSVIVPTELEMDADHEPLMQTLFGTLYAAAPEIWLKQRYTRAVDSWGIGVILFMCLTGMPPFSDFGGAADHMNRIIKAKYQTPEPQWAALSDKAKDLIAHLLVADPKQRLPVEYILRHPWFRVPMPQASFESARKRTRRLSTLMRVRTAPKPLPAPVVPVPTDDHEDASTAPNGTPAAGSG